MQIQKEIMSNSLAITAAEISQTYDDEMPDYTGTATYSPQDNKLRMTAFGRLDPALYARVKAAGFSWAPRQEIFVAPMWTPAREDLMTELCGEIEDEDSTMAERAKDRAERFSNYQTKRGAEAMAAHAAVARIGGRFEFGQPILVGHHSERGARKDKERMDNGMRKAVQLWDTSEYWASRAEGALAHANHKEDPAVRARRIKTLQAGRRVHERTEATCAERLLLWKAEGLTTARALLLSNNSHFSKCFLLADFPRDAPASQYEGQISLWSALDGGILTGEQARDLVIPSLNRTLVWVARWLTHYENRIAYERAMLGESGGLKADGFDIQPGGRVLVRGEWCVVKRVTKRDGTTLSVTVIASWSRVVAIEKIQDYRAPAADEAEALKSVTALPPLCNYPGEGFHAMTKSEWAAIHADYKGSRRLGQGVKADTSGNVYGAPIRAAVETAKAMGLHRVRCAMVHSNLTPVFITDQKRTDAPAFVVTTTELAAPVNLAPEVDTGTVAARIERATNRAEPTPDPMADIRGILKSGGVQVVSAPQLYPTPADLAARMVELADIRMGSRVLEPSAGTGALLRALPGVLPWGACRQTWVEVFAIEISPEVTKALRGENLAHTVRCADFLEITVTELGQFDCVLMNPPFSGASDIAHIQHARQFLKLGGRLVAICANGPRQQAILQPLAEESGGFYEPLPADTFKEAGTSVNTALLMIEG